MSFASFIKRHKVAVIVTLSVIIICIVGIIAFISILPRDNDIGQDEAIAIAKKDFGCDKVLWIELYGACLSSEPQDEFHKKIRRSHFAYYVVGENKGKEVFIVIPSDPSLEKAFTTMWRPDYTFKQIVEKFNEHGANYSAKVPDNYSKVDRDYIELRVGKESLYGIGKYYIDNSEEAAEAFFNRLDIKAAFYYQWQEGKILHRCIVTQENGELKSYEKLLPV